MKSYFSAIFGRSPIRPLQRHMEKVMECARELVPLFEAVGAQEFTRVEELQTRVSRLEDEADDLKKELRLQLPNTLFLPVDRRDLLELLRTQDMIANRAKDIAGVIRGRRMVIPDQLLPLFKDYVGRNVDAVEQALRTVKEMDDLVETGFRGNEVERVQALLKELDRLEKETDHMQVELRATLRGLESELPPVDVMFLYKIIEWTGDLADHAERVGSRLQIMLAR